MMMINATSRVSASALGLVSSAVETQAEANDTPTPKKADTAEAAKSTGFGSLLMPSTAGNLLNLLADAPETDAGTTSLTPKLWLSKTMNLANSGASGSKAGEANYYSQSDLDTIKVSTGYNLVVMNGATAVVDDEGNPAPRDVAEKVSHLAATIEGDRAAGVFKGEVTSDYLRDVFDRFADAKDALPSEWLDNAINYLQGQGTSSTAGA